MSYVAKHAISPRLRVQLRRAVPTGRAGIRATCTAVVAGILVVVMSTSASARWSTLGAGTGIAHTGTLTAPTVVAGAQTAGTGTVSVSWHASSGTPAPTGYYVVRVPSSGPSQPACGTSTASTTASTSCSDNGVALGTYTYLVVAVLNSWTATSAPSAAVTVAQTTQSITFTSSPVSPTFGGTYPVTATGGASGNPVVFGTSTSGVCTVSGSTVSFVHAGICTLTADQAGSTYYNAAPQATQQFQVAKAPQTVSFTSTAPTNAVVGGTGYTPSATGGGSGNPTTFSIDPTASTVCSISGGVVTYQHVGTCVVDADQAGNADYLTANRVQQSIAVGKGSQAINFTSSAPVGAKVNGSTYTVTATGGPSGNAVTFSTATASVCTVAGSTVSFVGAGTCTINADQAGSADYLAAAQMQQSFSVTKNGQTITFMSTAPASATFGGSYSATATATSGLTVTFGTDTASVCTVSSGGSVSFVGVGTCHVNADQAGNFAFNPAPQVQQSFAVAKANQAITFTSTAPSNAAVGGATYTVTATGGGSGNPVTFSSATAGVCTVTGSTVSFVGAGTCTINANQAGNANYNVAPQKQQSFAVAADTTAPSFVSTYPSGGNFSQANPFSASPCGADRVCATVTDAGTGVASVTYTITADNGKCWNGSAFVNGPCTANSMSLNSGTAANGVWRSGSTAITPLVSGNNRGYTLVFTATDVQGNVSTATVTFISS